MKTNKKTRIIKTATAKLPTIYGAFTITIYKSSDGEEHAALSIGNPGGESILTRIHSQCLTGDTFSSLRCDCGEQLHQSMKKISKEKRGVVLYLNQEGRSIGLSNKIKAYALQEQGLDTVEANHALGFPTDARDYGIAAEILRDFGISSIVLLTNNPDKIDQLTKQGIQVVKRLPVETVPNTSNKNYLIAKKRKMQHYLTHIDLYEK